MVDEVALLEGFLLVLLFCFVSIITAMVDNHFHLKATLLRRTTGRTLETFKQSNALSGVAERWIEKHLYVDTLPRSV